MQISTVNLWSSSIFLTKLDLSSQFLTDLKNFLINLSNQDKIGKIASNVGGWHSSYDLFSYENSEIQEVHKKVKEIITWLYTKNNKSFFESHKLAMNSWANINSDHTYQSFHNHAEWALSAVFYVSVPEVDANSKNGALTFQDFSSRSVNPNYRDLTHLFGERQRSLKVNTSDLVIFPSYLPHAVTPTYLKEPRITIAFNFLAIKI